MDVCTAKCDLRKGIKLTDKILLKFESIAHVFTSIIFQAHYNFSKFNFGVKCWLFRGSEVAVCVFYAYKNLYQNLNI